MIGFQKFIAMGIVKDEPKVFNVGASRKAQVRLEVPRTYVDKDGNQKSVTDRIDVTFWGKNADRAEFVTAGSWIYVEGRYATDSYDDKDGKKVWKNYINADVLQTSVQVQEEVPY